MSEPIGPVIDLKLWGVPYHGVLTDGTLTLPNSAQKSFTQPINGNTRLVKFSTTPQVNRTQEQLTEDASNGREWRDYEIISGDALDIADLNNAWLHKDESNRTWKVQATIDGGQLRLSCGLFGVFSTVGKTHETATVVVDISSSGITSLTSIELMDSKPDGTAAAFKLNDRALVELLVSGLGSGPVVGLSITYKAFDDAFVIGDDVFNVRERTPNGEGLFRWYFDRQETLGPGGPYTCAAERADFTIALQSTPSSVFFASGNERYDWNAYRRSSTNYHWMFYKTDGSLSMVSLHKQAEQLNISEIQEYTAPSGLSGYILYEWQGTEGVSGYCEEAPLVSSGSASWSNSTGDGKRLSAEIAVKVDDVEVDKVTVEASEMSTIKTDFTRTTANNSSANDSSVNTSYDQSIVKINGVTVKDEAALIFSSDFWSSYINDVFSGSLVFISSAVDNVSPDIELKMLSNKLISLVTTNRPGGDYTYRQCVAPDLIDGVQITQPDQNSEFSTYQPFTTEIVRNQDDPVCFV